MRVVETDFVVALGDLLGLTDRLYELFNFFIE